MVVVVGKVAGNLPVQRLQLAEVVEDYWSALAAEKPASWPDHMNLASR